jgi:hypothetical protein
MESRKSNSGTLGGVLVKSGFQLPALLYVKQSSLVIVNIINACSICLSRWYLHDEGQGTILYSTPV